ncbi:octopamine receptor beta-2R-like [Lytechinus pictus]|uniref:octopamine receptor beta-2R-like n=1 Tax=Lytechinus pictus TaxID=7653 RepID=UPI0030B9D5C8
MSSLDMIPSLNTSPTSYDQSDNVTIYHESTSLVAVIEGLTLFIVFLGALIANLLAMTAIIRDKVLRGNLHNWLILNLIINDLSFTILCTPFAIVSVFDHGYFLIHHRAACLINGSILFGIGNFATVVAISVDRYLIVVWPGRFPLSKPRTIAFIVITWVIASAAALPSLFGVVSEIRYKENAHTCLPEWQNDCFYYTTLVTIVYGAIVPMMIFCYVGVFLHVWRQKRLLRSHAVLQPGTASHVMTVLEVGKPNEGATSLNLTTTTLGHPTQSPNTEEADPEFAGRENKEHETVQQGVVALRSKDKNHRSMEKKLNIEKRIALTGTLLVLTTVVCWTPYGIVNSCSLSLDVSHWLDVLTAWLVCSNLLFDPLVYSFLNRRVRNSYRNLLRSWLNRWH